MKGKCYVCGQVKEPVFYANGDGTGPIVCLSCSSALARVLELEEALKYSIRFAKRDDLFDADYAEGVLKKNL